MSLYGICETEFLKCLSGNLPITKKMLMGREKHRELLKTKENLSTQEIIERIKLGKKFRLHEFKLIDEKFKLIGKIDCLSFLGNLKGSEKNLVLLIDYKYSSANSLPLSWKIQLGAYEFILKNSFLSDFCEIEKGRIICLDEKNKIRKIFDVDKKKLEVWAEKIPFIIQEAFSINKRNALHRRFDIEKNSWIKCLCKNIK